MNFIKSWFSSPVSPPPEAAKALLPLVVPDVLPRLQAESFSSIVERAEQKDLAPLPTTPALHLRALLAEEKYPEAVAFLAFGLPEHAAVRWALECYKIQGRQRSEADHAAFVSAQSWSAAPSEALQKQTAGAAEKSGHNGPGAWVAQAVGLVKQPERPAPDSVPDVLVGKAVKGSIMLSAALSEAGAEIPKAPTLADLPPPPPPASPEALAAAAKAQGLQSAGTQLAQAAGLPPGAAGLAAPGAPGAAAAALQPGALAKELGQSALQQPLQGLVAPAAPLQGLAGAAGKLGAAPGAPGDPKALAAELAKQGSQKGLEGLQTKAGLPAGGLPQAQADLATLAKPPPPSAEELKKLFNIYRPFIEKGLAIAAGG